MNSINRRRFIQGTVATAASLSMGASSGTGDQESKAARESLGLPRDGEWIDVNVNLFRWPFDRMRGDEASELVEMLSRRGVTEAWAGSLEGLLHKDMRSVNARLAEHCRRYGDGMLVPFGSINPRWADWPEDLRRCHEEHGMPGIRLHPNYHGYGLDNPLFPKVLEAAAERDLIVQLVPWMEDERVQHPLMPVPTTDLGPLPDQLDRFPDLRLMLLNSYRAPNRQAVRLLKGYDRVYYDFSKLDVVDPLTKLLEEVPIERICFGSHSPLFHFESHVLKMQESGLEEAQVRRICRENARSVLPRA